MSSASPELALAMNQRFPSNSTREVIMGRLRRLPPRAAVVSIAMRLFFMSFRNFLTDPLPLAVPAWVPFFAILSPLQALSAVLRCATCKGDARHRPRLPFPHHTYPGGNSHCD